MANFNRTCDCGECRKCYKREWARNARLDPKVRKRDIEASRRYQSTDKGQEAKVRSNKTYRKIHAEQIAEDKRERYHALSPEEKATRNRRYNWRRRYGVDPIPLDDRCAWCGSIEQLELDHMHPVILGGKTTPDNLWTLCRSCNAFKQDRLVTPGLGVLIGC